MASPNIQRVPVSRPPAVSKGYNLASTWDQNALLSETQLDCIVSLSKFSSERPIPTHLLHENDNSTATAVVEKDSFLKNENFDDLILVNSHQFYKWYSDMEASMKSETEEKYNHYVHSLNENAKICDIILTQVDDTLFLFDELQSQHHAVQKKTKNLHDSCQKLVLEKEKLFEFVEALRSKLNYFDELEKMTEKFHSPEMNVTNPHFLPLLKRLDECIAYVGNNLHYADSSNYLIKFRQLHSRALGIIRSHLVTVLKMASVQIQNAVKENTSGESTNNFVSESVETSLLYVRFKSITAELKPVFEELENRRSKKDYLQIINDCHSLYFKERFFLVQSIVKKRIFDFSQKENLTSFTRSGCAYLMQVCQLEHQLFDYFFPHSSSDSSNLTPLIDPLCMILYDNLRPRFIHESNIDLLCELIYILKSEIFEEQMNKKNEIFILLKPTIDRILADIQERLIFRAETFLRDEITNFTPSAEELDYPKILIELNASKDEDDEEIMKDNFYTWYPPLEKTLSCISKLYRCIDSDIFNGIAKEAIMICASSIEKGSKLISRKSTMDSQLFLIKNLLILREQIVPFDVEFSVTVKELDFSHMLGHLKRVIQGKAPVFGFSATSSISRLSPRVRESHVDAKKEIEKNLKLTCELFIMSITKLIVEPLLSFITKVTAVKVSMSASLKKKILNNEITNLDPKLSSDYFLSKQAFASPQKVKEMLTQIEKSLSDDLPKIADKMKLYLQSSSTRSILFKPIKSNIMEAYKQVITLIQSEYSLEDQASIAFTSEEKLQQTLDNMA